MNFYNFLLEMSQEEALKTFNIKLGFTEDELRKVYKSLSKVHHPDLGGSEDMMKKINAAFTLLKKSVGKTETKSYEELSKEYTELAKGIVDDLNSKFKQDIFEAYFKKIAEVDFITTITNYPDKNFKGKTTPYYASMKVEFKSKDGKFIIKMDVTTSNLTDIKYSKGLASSTNDYKIYTVTEAIAYNKTHKFGKSKWTFLDSHKVLNDPSILFPEKKLLDIFSGSTSNRKFSKRDMVAVINNKMNGKAGSGKDTYIIQLQDDIYFAIYRMTFMRTAAWMFNTYLYQKYKHVGSITGVISLPETEETAELLVDLYNDLKRLGNNPDKIVKAIEKFIKENKMK